MPCQFKFMLIKKSFTTICKFTELRKQKSQKLKLVSFIQLYKYTTLE